jgi:hypothetical protein
MAYEHQLKSEVVLRLKHRLEGPLFLLVHIWVAAHASATKRRGYNLGWLLKVYSPYFIL